MKKTLAILALTAIGASTLSGCDLYPPYRIYSQRIDGEAELAKAEYSKQVQIKDAQAKLESAKALASAEVERAKGVAQANQIIGDSLKNNEMYLRYLWIHNMENETNKTVVYVPTETNLPVLESQRLAQVK